MKREERKTIPAAWIGKGDSEKLSNKSKTASMAGRITWKMEGLKMASRY